MKDVNLNAPVEVDFSKPVERKSKTIQKIRSVFSIFSVLIFFAGAAVGLYLYAKEKSRTLELEERVVQLQTKAKELKAIQREHSELTFDVLRRNSKEGMAMSVVERAFFHTKKLEDMPVESTALVVTSGRQISNGFEVFIYVPAGRHFLELEHSVSGQGESRNEKDRAWVKDNFEFSLADDGSRQKTVELKPDTKHRFRVQLVSQAGKSKMEIDLVTELGESLFSIRRDHPVLNKVRPKFNVGYFKDVYNARASLPSQLTSVNRDDALNRNVSMYLPLDMKDRPKDIHAVVHLFQMQITTPDVAFSLRPADVVEFSGAGTNSLNERFRIDEQTGRIFSKYQDE